MSTGRKRNPKRDVHGWLVLDKPTGMTSNAALAAVKRFYRPKKAGHAGTLDPLATGMLPIAFGEATKTVPFVMDGRKVYRFTVDWGTQTDTDDSEGTPVAHSDLRPDEAAIRDALPAFRGTIDQVPPQFSALKINGERAYDLARDGEMVALDARPVTLHRLDLVDCPNADQAIFEAECGKGTYVRSLARDIGLALGTRGHVSALRRLLVGPFGEEAMISLEKINSLAHSAPREEDLALLLHPVETALDDIPALAINRTEAARLRRGQPILLRGRDAPSVSGPTCVMSAGALVAIGEIDRGELRPKRVFNLPDVSSHRADLQED
ncbi:MAG: tRNA pseudouridine(55) synthase TruB [Pseudomonadota bacterium]